MKLPIVCSYKVKNIANKTQNNAKCKIRSSDPSGRKSAALAGAARSVGAEALSSVPLRPAAAAMFLSIRG